MRNIRHTCFKGGYSISRIDFRIDNYTDDYADYLKINRIILSILAIQLDIRKDVWQSNHLIDMYTKSVRVYSNRYEIEYYDRYDKTGQEGLTRSRLELRNKCLSCGDCDVKQLLNDWRERLKVLPSGYSNLQDELNRALFELWKRERAHSATTNIYEFIKYNQLYICTSKQLASLLEMMGIKNCSSLAYTYAKRADIEMISKGDLEAYIRQVTKSLTKFRGIR